MAPIIVVGISKIAAEQVSRASVSTVSSARPAESWRYTGVIHVSSAGVASAEHAMSVSAAANHLSGERTRSDNRPER